jgi:hypothetical protein
LERSSVHLEFFFSLCHGRLARAQQITKERNEAFFQSVFPGLRQDYVPTHYVLGCHLNVSHLSAQALLPTHLNLEAAIESEGINDESES